MSQPDAVPSPAPTQVPNDLFEPQPLRLARALVGEARDAAWDDVVEPALDEWFAGSRALVGREVRCGTTMCQVSGRLASTGPGSIDDAMHVLQGPDLEVRVKGPGLKHVISSFGPSKDAPKQARYIAFWSRMHVR